MDKASVFRMVGLIIVLLNAVMAIFGVAFVIPAEMNEMVTSVILVAYGLYAAWKNNYISKKGKAQKAALEKEGLK